MTALTWTRWRRDLGFHKGDSTGDYTRWHLIGGPFECPYLKNAVIPADAETTTTKPESGTCRVCSRLEQLHGDGT